MESSPTLITTTTPGTTLEGQSFTAKVDGAYSTDTQTSVRGGLPVTISGLAVSPASQGNAILTRSKTEILASTSGQGIEKTILSSNARDPSSITETPSSIADGLSSFPVSPSSTPSSASNGISTVVGNVNGGANLTTNSSQMMTGGTSPVPFTGGALRGDVELVLKFWIASVFSIFLCVTML